MIRELLSELYSAHRSIVGDGTVFVLYIAAVIFVAELSGEKGRIRPLILSVPATICAAVAYAFEKVCELPFKRKIPRYAAVVFAAALMLLAVASSGKQVFSREVCELSENTMHLPQGIMTAMENVPDEKKEVRVLIPCEWKAYLNAFSTRFVTPYDDDDPVSEDDRHILETELSGLRPDMRKVSQIAHKGGFTYAIIPDDIWPEVPIDRLGYELILDCGTCSLYREVRDSDD